MEFSGPTFKQLREQKNFSVKETAGEIVTPQFLRKYEAGKCDISLNNFLKLLARINVTLNEFTQQYEGETFNSWMDEVESEFIVAFHGSDSLKATALAEKLKRQAETSTDIRYRLYYTVFSDLINRNFYRINDHDLTEVRDYLNNVNTWGRFEYSLVTFADFPIETDRLYMITKDILRNHRNKTLDDRYACDFIVHVGLHFFSKGKHALAKQIYDDYFKYSFAENNVDNLLFDVFSRYCQGVIRATEGDEEAATMVREIAHFLGETIGHKGYANRLNIMFHQSVKMLSKKTEQGPA